MRQLLFPIADARFDEHLDAWKGGVVRSWREFRPEVVTDPDRVAAHRKHLDAEVRAYRLAEIRKEHDLTQSEVADLIGVTQPNGSRLEGGCPSRTSALHASGTNTL